MPANMMSEPAEVEAVGHRQQQGDGGGRAYAGQHADEGAERHADERVEQIYRLDGDAEALDEEIEGAHQAELSA